MLLPVVFAAALASIFPGPSAAAAPDAPGARKVVMVVIDRIGLDDLTPSVTPNILRLAGEGGISLMNARVKRDVYGPGGYTDIGAGGRAISGLNGGLAFNSGEMLQTVGAGLVPAADVFLSRTGQKAPPGGVVNLYIEEMVRNSDTPQATSTPGLLGQALKEDGRRAQIVGNADSLVPEGTVQQFAASQAATPQVPFAEPGALGMVNVIHRESCCILMDTGGVVENGDVSQRLTVRSPAPGGIETDFAGLLAEAQTRLPSSDLLVVDMGQTARVDEQSQFMTDDAQDRARAEALAQSDEALGALLGGLDTSRDLVIVCTPTPTRKMIKDGNLLTPLVIAGPGIEDGTRLYSTTTRRAGLVSSFDLAPTVLSRLGVEVPAEMDGDAVTSRGAADMEGLRRMQDRAVGAYNSRKLMVKIYIITAMVLVGLLFLLLLFREDLLARHRAMASIAMLALLAGPLVYLVVPAFATPDPAWLIPSTVAGCIVAGAVAYTLAGRDTSGEKTLATGLMRPMLLVSGVTLFAILLDTALGSRLMTYSPFGSDIILGDRYYGIGNLYMGFAIGAAMLFAALCPAVFRERLDKPWKRYTLTAVVLGVSAIVIGGPRMGSEVGGLLALVAGGSIMLMKQEGGRVTLRKAFLVVVIVLVCVAGLLLLDVVLPGSRSHAARAVSKAGGGGISPILSQVSRKLAANWSLATSSTWRLLLLLLFVEVLILNWKLRLFGKIEDEIPEITGGLVGMAVALVVALLFNDSGIESASAVGVYLFVPCLMLLVPRRGVKTAGPEGP